jgi:antitoxin PrlF
MDAMARMSSKGQVTVPKPVREALELGEGDTVVFRVHEGRAVLAKTPNLIDLAGSVPVPAAKRGMPWDEIRKQAHAEWARRSR